MFIEAKNLSCSFDNAERPLFEAVDIVLENKLQFLVGRNGVGKSQLAAILAGKKSPGKGSVKHFGSIGYLAQQGESFASTGADYLGISKLLAANQAITAGQGTEQDFGLMEGNWDIEAVIDKRLQEGGLSRRVLAQRLNQLSGGERTRLSLLALKYSKHDFLILDEPGNHLDQEGRKWLLQWIQAFKNSLVISHDRSLLKHSDTLFELSEKGVHRFRGGWDTYMSARHQLVLGATRQAELAKKHHQQARRTQQRDLERLESSSAKGKKGRNASNQSKIILNSNKSSSERTQAKTARLNQERLEKTAEELRIAKNLQERIDPLAFVVAPSIPANGHLIYLENIVLPYGYREPLCWQMQPRERIAIKGRNGSGKSTLLNVLAGTLKPVSGTCKITPHCAMLDQNLSMLDLNSSALENFKRLAPGWEEYQYRSILAQLRLRKDFALYPISWLSGGERLKVALAALFCGPNSPSLLLLDEPDNHIDLESRELLESALSRYGGGLVLVSHDEAFAANVGIHRSIDM